MVLMDIGNEEQLSTMVLVSETDRYIFTQPKNSCKGPKLKLQSAPLQPTCRPIWRQPKHFIRPLSSIIRSAPEYMGGGVEVDVVQVR